MRIDLKYVTIRELTSGFKDNADDGVVGYSGRLDIRPPYQREFIYKDKQRESVIETVTKDFPLNVMYWAVREDGSFEVIDGQQRTISICQYVNGEYSAVLNDIPNYRAFHNLQADEREQILNYKLTVYLCSGEPSERLKWFRIINIAGEKLTEQELLNASYSGSWLSDAKRHFSKNGCAAQGLGSNYLSGSAIRQEYLETVLSWISNGNIEIYMLKHQHDPDANALWLYFQSVINWVKAIFPKYRKEMKGLKWGIFYNEFKDKRLNHKELEEEIARLMKDEDVTYKKGIYEYVLTRKEKHLNIRAFSDSQKTEAYERQKGVCAVCGETFLMDEMEADHITPWHQGGKTNTANCQMLCREDNRRKSGK